MSDQTMQGDEPLDGPDAQPDGLDSSDMRQQAAQARSGMAGRMGAAGMPAEKSHNFKASTRKLLGELRTERVLVTVVLVLSVVSVALYAIGPRVLGRATDVIFEGLMGSSHQIDFTELHSTLVIAILVYTVSAFMAWIQSWLLAGIVQRTMYRLREKVQAKLDRLPLSYVDHMPRGDLLSRVTNDIDNLSQAMQQSMSQMLTSLLQILAVTVMMISISWLLALFAIAIIPAAMFILKFIAARSRTRFIAQWRYTGELNAQVEEAFTGHAIVKVFGRQPQVEHRFDAKNEELFEASFGAQFISGVIQPVMMFLGNLNYVAIAVVGGAKVASGQISLGDVQAFIQYSRQFTQPLTQLASMFNVMQSGVASAERIFEFLEAPEQSDDSEMTPSHGVPVGRVEFENVSFSYDPDEPLIEDLSFVAEPGQTVAIVGPTGAGKTTLVNLIMRFYEIDSGRITLDGRDTSMMKRRDLRRDIGMVLQDTWLFGGTIRENIAFGNPDASEEQITAAAKAAYVDRFVHTLTDGYDTVLDDEGTSVSAGEKQLLTIARAFLADPAILILDEATSSVDTRTEMLIQDAMAELRSSRTSFVIAHRLSTIRDAHTILVMEHGHIVEQGDHESLLAAGGAYYNLYNAQFAGAAADVE